VGAWVRGCVRVHWHKYMLKLRKHMLKLRKHMRQVRRHPVVGTKRGTRGTHLTHQGCKRDES
jgi:hypothetical protein